MNGPAVLSFGCRLNAAEGEAIRRHLAAAGRHDAVVLNGCAVTAEAEAQLRQAIRKARRERPGAEIVVTGCAAQIHPERYAALPEVDRVVGNAEKLRPETWRRGANARVQVGDLRQAPPPLPLSNATTRTRAFLTIQQGCDHACSFCVIPQGRGANRSVPAPALIAEARRLVAGGCREIVLTGVDIASWGRDLPGGGLLGDLVTALLEAVPDLPRLRLSTLDPAALDESLLRAFAAQPRLMPQLHLSVQAGDDLILKRMKRRHLRADVIAAARRLRAARPGLVLGADLIAGFPTESEAQFQRTLGLVAEAGLTWLHVFPYAARPGTPAARMPQVPMALRRERAGRLRALGQAGAEAFLQAQVGRSARVLVERGGQGYSEHYAPVRLGAPAGRLVEARVERVEAGRLVARVLELAA
jgi:threonylcarbamoyladenosine tRNA methylthiotransferase MtaB